jgi:tetratricopeptide (TPR) repeat protein/class 3 adenylate cyclase
MTPPNENFANLSPTKGNRVHKTFLFTDIVQSTDIRAASIREFGDTGNQKYDNELLAPHDEILNRLVAEFNGEVISTAGDSYFVAFDSAQSAVRCAVTIQSELIKQRIPLPVSEPELPPYLQIRLGLHTGGARELSRAGRPNYSDHTINIAARIENLADGEQVLMSEETWNSAGRLERVAKFEWEGYELKGVDGTWTLIEALWDGRTPRVPRLHAQPAFNLGRTAPPFILPQLDVATFTGRVEELRRLESLLLKPDVTKVCSIVGLAGGGGFGKSALACHFASLHRDAFPDGVLGLRVDGKNNDTIAREFSRLCGEEIALEDERQAATIMQDVFAQRRMLLIFDNAEDAAIQELRPGGQTCAVIITTRDRELPFLVDVSAEGCIDVLPLPAPDARLLLEQLIGKARVAAEPEAIEEIINLIGSLPLALQIVGSALHLQQDRGIADYAASLLAERERLEMLKVRGASHLDVLASFSLSLRLLADDEIDFFACQSVCAQDGFSVQAASAAGGCDEFTAYNRLNYLYRLSLLNRPRLGVGRYVFHTLIRLFAQDLSVERSITTSAGERHARYFIQLVKTNKASRHRITLLAVEDASDCVLAAAWLQQQQIIDYEFVTGLEDFLEEHGYFQHAVTLMTDFLPLAEHKGDWSVVVRLLIKRARYLSLLGNRDEAEQTMVLAADTIDRVEHDEARLNLKAKWFSNLASTWQHKGYFEEAADAFQKSIVINEQTGNLDRQATVLNRVASVLQRQGHFDRAMEVLQRSRAIFEQLGDQRNLAKVLNSMGCVLERQGQFQAAATEFRLSAEIEVHLANRRGEAIVLNSLGGALERQGKLDEAIEAFQRSIAISDELGDQRCLAMALNSLGSVLQRKGQLDEAMDALKRSADIGESRGDFLHLAMVINSMGGVLQRQGQFDEAVDAFRRSMSISEQLGDEQSLSIVLHRLGHTLLRQGKLEAAMDALLRSADIGEHLGDTLHSAMVLNTIGGLLHRQGQLDKAVTTFQSSAAIFEQLGDQRSLANVLSGLGVVQEQAGKLADAMDTFGRSIAILERIGNQHGLATVLNNMGGVLQRQELFDEALVIFRRSMTVSETANDLPSLARAHFSIGNAFLSLRDTTEAISHLRRSFEINESLGIRYGVRVVTPLLAQTLVKLGRVDEAQDFFRRASAFEPENASLNKLGVIKRIILHPRGHRYGFITPDAAGGDIYFQERDVQPENLMNITDGARVEFDVLLVGQRLQAKNVRII